jgi:transketolase
MEDLRSVAHDIRRIVLDRSKRANVGHIGSSLSVADILAALYGSVLRDVAPDDPDRDRFILSKGHAALGLYAALSLCGVLPEDRLDSYCSDGTSLGGHPEHALDGVDFSTGSLGHGLSIGCGAALAARLQGSKRRVFVLLSDAELNEGSVWEAVMFAGQHRLGNLVAVIDANGQQALGATREVLDLEPIAERFAAFRWDAAEVDGHDPDGLAERIRDLETSVGAPHALVARTVFGKGVSYMEGKLDWHYWPMSDEQYAQASAELDAATAERAVP